MSLRRIPERVVPSPPFSLMCSLRTYATKREIPPSRTVQNINDPRLALIKSILYDKETQADTTAASFTRPQNSDKVEIVERAWKIVQQRRKEREQDDLRRKYYAMRAATEELERTDPRLFRGATETSAEGSDEDTVTTFAGGIRVATDTPPTS
ncbi:hypothetical protein HDU93_005276 [Gonapodya sp. JEL0774]|nr:hypothetical protein HDU93_005276 [Gonapodya sp. JEL0774]